LNSIALFPHSGAHLAHQELAKKNPPVQEQVYNKLAILMAIPCCEQQLGRLLSEVFVTNKSLSLQ
jgi:hypothetical protein